MLFQYVKKGAYNTIFYTASSFVSRAISFLFLPYLLSKLSLEEFGIWDFYQTIFSNGTLIFSSIAANGLFRFYLLYKDDPEKQRESLGNGFYLVLFNSLFLPFIGLFLLSYLYPEIKNNSYIYITLASISSFSCFSVVLAYFRVKESLWTYSFLYIGQNLIAIGLTLCGLYLGYGIKSFFYANFVSFNVFLPLFIYLLLKFNFFSIKIFKPQLSYSIPIFFYALIYNYFFVIDRLIIKQNLGYESLGTYSLLWRFGSIFQFFSIGLISASSLVIFSAEKESDNHFLISKLMTYFIGTLISVCLLTIVVAQSTINYAFPHKYHYLIKYLPLFFMPIVFLECARLFQTSFRLSKKTLPIPIIGIVTLSLQTLLLYFFSYQGLWGIFLANTTAFIFYAGASYFIGRLITKSNIIETNRITALLGAFFAYCSGLQFLSSNNAKWYYTLLIGISWPIALWFSKIINMDEKKWIKKHLLKLKSTAPSLKRIKFAKKLETINDPAINTKANEKLKENN